MIAVALAMIRARVVGAATTFLLATFAIAAAVAAPVYLRVAADSVAAADYAAVPANERLIVANAGVQVRADESDVDGQATVQAHRQRAFDNRVSRAMTAEGFLTHLAVFFPIALADGPDGLPAELPDQHLEFRENSCQHVQVVVGRCPAAPGEVIVGESTAATHTLRPGATVHVQSMMLVPVPQELPQWFPAGAPSELSVVGVYRSLPGTEIYWTGSTSPAGGRSEPVLADRSTLVAVDHERETQMVVAYPSVASAHGLVRADVDQMLNRVRAAGASPVTGIPALLDRIDADRRQSALLPTVAAVPLVLLCCFVLYLAAANAAQVRRLEFGMLKLHGSTRPDRLWLGSAEILLPVFAGALVGYVVGHVGVWLFGRATLGGPVELSLTADALPQAAAALAAAVVVCLLGLRRNLAAPVVDLLRRVPSRSARGAGLVARVIALALAVAAVVQLRTTPDLSDVSILAPAAAILAVAVIGAVAFDRVAGRWGRRALDRGRLGLALGLLHLGRRRAGARLLALLAVAIGLVGFAAAAADTATRARQEQVALRLGAERVVTVRPVSMRTLLSTVRAVDPDGSYAMAVMPLPGLRTPVPLLAVDSPRLARVATPAGLDTAAAAALRPEVGRTVELRGDGLVLRAGLAGGIDEGGTLVTAILAPIDGSPPLTRTFGPLRAGEQTYRADVDCPAGCRLENLAFSYISHAPPDVDPGEVTVTLMTLTQTGPDAVLAGADDLAAWADHHGAPLRLETTPSGLAVSLGPTFADGLVGPADTPDSLSGLAAGQGVLVLGIPAPRRPIVIATVVRTAPVLPRLGAVGGLVDMEYLARFDEPGMTAPGEVWLAPHAPADIVERLAAAGLTVDGVRERAAELTAAADRPNAVGVRFFLLVGVLCLLLAAGGLALAGGVEIETRAEELRALRAQGLPRRVVRRAGRLSYLMVVAAGAVLGGLAGAVAWIATSDRLPLVDQLITGLTTPRWPGPATAWAIGVSTVVLGGVAVLVAAVMSYRSQRGVAVRGTGREGSRSS
jgi:putative ABC transport system permease protein